jgi:hypothetical protein
MVMIRSSAGMLEDMSSVVLPLPVPPETSMFSLAGDRSCEFVVMPVLTRVTPGSFSGIRGFACMHILNAESGNGKYIELQMSTLCKSPNSSGVGPNYGVMSPPSLFR